MLTRSSAYVELTPTRLELAVCVGGVVTQSRVERYNPPEAGADLAEMLRSRHATLAGWVAELEQRGTPTTLVFWTPTTTCGVVSVPAALTGTAARQATRLALGDLAGYPAGQHPSDTQHLLTDIAAWARAGAGVGHPMSHSLAMVEQEATCELLADWVGSCGLSVRAMLPVNAGPITATLRELTALGRTGGTDAAARATLWMGEHESFLAVGGPTGLALFRPLGLGVESLVEVLQRPIQPRTPGASAVTIDRAQARSIIERCGVPLAGDVVDARGDLAGSGVLPLLSPVLQRCAVEIKQSLRFGLAEKDRTGLVVTVTGPGAAIPRLAEVLSGLCQSPVEAAGTASENTSAARGNIAALRRCPELTASILPSGMLGEQLAARARRSLRVGLAAAMVMACGYAGWSYLALGSARLHAQAIGLAASTAKASDEQRRASVAAAGAVRRAGGSVAEAMGSSSAWGGVLSALAHVTPEHTTLTGLELGDTEPALGPTARLTCAMKASDDAAFASQLRAYITTLEALPGVAGVRMGGTSRAGGSARSDRPVVYDVFSFDLTLTLVRLPYVHLAPEALETALGRPTRPTGKPNPQQAPQASAGDAGNAGNLGAQP